MVLVLWIGTALAVSDAGDRALAVGTVATGFTVGALIMAAAHLTLFRNRSTRPVPVWWVAALGALAWLATLPIRLSFGFGVQYGTVAVTGSRVALVAVAMAVQGAAASRIRPAI